MRIALRLAACSGFLLAACVAGSGERAPSDRPARRIISLIPSVTETIVALGAADRLVARSEFDHDPVLAHLPSVGEGLTPSLEQLAMLQPDLVIAWPANPARSVLGRLEDLGIAVYAPEIQNLNDIRRTTGELGELLDLEAAADSLIAAIDAGLEEVRRAVAGRDRPEVFYVVWYDPPTTAGPGTYISELIEIAGGVNMFADAPGLWPQVSLEEVVRRSPDIVLVAQTERNLIDVESLRSAPGWRELAAVRDGYVIQIDANLYNRPGPRVTKAARDLALTLHPDAFTDGRSF